MAQVLRLLALSVAVQRQLVRTLPSVVAYQHHHHHHHQHNIFPTSLEPAQSRFLSTIQPSELSRALHTSNPSFDTAGKQKDAKRADHQIDRINSNNMSTFSYPEVRRNESIVETIFETKVEDPYRHLEDPQAEETKQFVEMQNKVTEPFLSKCSHRARIKEILRTNQDYKKIGCPFKRGSKYYFFMNTGLQPQSVLYQQDTLDSEPRVFFDPNLLSDDGTVALSLSSFSPSGEYYGYGLSYSGSDWIEIGVKNVTTGKELGERLKRAKFTSIEWTHDNKGFFYAQYPSHRGDAKGTETESHENQSVYYHILGTEQEEDVLKVDFNDHPKWMIGFEVSHDGRYLHVFPRDGCQDNQWFFCDLSKFGPKDKLILTPIYNKMGYKFEYISNNGETVYFKTNLDATNYRIAKFNLSKPEKENWTDVIPNHVEDVLDWAEIYTVGNKDYILLNFLRKVVYYLELHELEGKVLKKFDLPPGTITKNSGRRKDDEFFFQFLSFLTPGQTYHFDLKKLDSEPKLLRVSEPKNFTASDYQTNQVFYKSKDGTEIPMFIIHRKDLVKDGSNPCLLYGYGGFNIQITPFFNINRIAWLKNFKGVLAIANIRGGGELGQSWHDSGRLLNKQNVFDDFIAGAEYLIESKYTNTDKLAIEGGSNGGLLVAATSNQRPDLIGASICHVGVLDMVRYTSFTIGHAWTSDYGDPKEKEHFDNVIKYSPYHNIPEKVDRYPATLLLTADHDDRVVPAHSLKFIAQLQHKLGKKLPNTPLMIRVDTKAGHGAGAPVAKVIDEYTDIYSFLYNALNLEKYYTDS